ncbi:MAG: hypothetical protein GX334_08465 [Firmicutes bacterium]|jgi:uncharacterized membrane protein YoaK (UPF0700 family)|nr:hypothetical protein [Bacillota bacterium]
MKVDEWGSLLSCLLLTVGMLTLPRIGFSTLEGLFTTAWTGLCVLVAAAFLKNFSIRR